MASLSVLQIGKRWRAQVRHPGRKSKSKTFDAKTEAQQWGRRMVLAIEEGERQAKTAGGEMLVGELIQTFRSARDEVGRPVDPTSNTHYMLEHLADDLGAERLIDLTPQRLAAWARQRQKEGAGGYTVNMELSQLGTVIRHTASFLNATLPDVVGQARPFLDYNELISGGTKRTRRPSEDEETAVLAWLAENRSPVVRRAVQVGAIVGLRRGELARIQKADLDELHRAVLVRQRKHPRRKQARDEWVPLLGDAWAIVQEQLAENEPGEARIFPVSREALTDSVTAAVRALGIPNLHLHDFRRGANSRLREMGFDKDARKAILGHRTDEMNERYTDVTLSSLHAQFDAATRGSQPRRPRQRSASGRRRASTGTRRETDGS